MTVRGVLVLVAATLGACSGHHSASPPVTTTSGPPLRYVAVGASETVGVGADDPQQEAWPRVFLRTALPPGTAFVNVGVSGATVADALTREAGAAVDARPDLVTVWLNVNDLIAGVPAERYESQLDDLVHRLRRDGATRLLVANTPELDELPVYIHCRINPADPLCLAALAGRPLPDPPAVRAAVAAYNAAIARVADREGAVLVDLHAAQARARADGTDASLVSGDGFHPSTAGHRAAAAAFAAALARARKG